MVKFSQKRQLHKSTDPQFGIVQHFLKLWFRFADVSHVPQTKRPVQNDLVLETGWGRLKRQIKIRQRKPALARFQVIAAQGPRRLEQRLVQSECLVENIWCKFNQFEINIELAKEHQIPRAIGVELYSRFGKG